MKNSREIITKRITSILLCLSIIFVGGISEKIYANEKMNSSNFYNIFSGIELNIVEEKINNGIMYKEYHNGKLVDTLFIENDKLYTDKLDGLVNYKRVELKSNPYSNMSKKLGNIYYDVSGYSRPIKLVVSYNKRGVSYNTTYTLKNKYASALAFGVDLAAALFMPASLAGIIAKSFVRKLISYGVLKFVTTGLEKVSGNTLSCIAQDEDFYVYAPYQAPDQPEVSKKLSGTIFTINMKGSSHINEKYYDGFTSLGWEDNEMGVNIGYNFFNNFFSIKKWEK